MANNTEQILKEFGLSYNEIKIYLASLALGTAKVNEIAKKADLLRTTTYEILKSLVEKGLASYIIKSGVKYFEVADPAELINILEERKNKVKSILPELEAIKKLVIEKPKIEVYEGKAGLKTILDDIIKTQPKELLTMSSSKILGILRFYFPHWIKRRIKAGIYARILAQKTQKAEEMKLNDKLRLREMRFLPENFEINTRIEIYANKIAILTLREEELIGIIIENKDIMETQKSLFNELWKTATS